MKTTTILLTIIFQVLAQTGKPEPKISIKLMPRICIAPCEALATLTVPPADDNDEVNLTLSAEDSPFFRLSTLSYRPILRTDGTLRYPAKTTQIRYPAIPKGNYKLVASLTKMDGKDEVVAITSQTIEVVGNDQD